MKRTYQICMFILAVGACVLAVLAMDAGTIWGMLLFLLLAFFFLWRSELLHIPEPIRERRWKPGGTE